MQTQDLYEEKKYSTELKLKQKPKRAMHWLP